MSNIVELTEKCIELVAIAIQLKVENAELRAYKELAQLSLNSDYTTAIRVYHQWCESGVQFDFHTWLQREIQRLHPPKAADDA